jgi:hypothetical protein
MNKKLLLGMLAIMLAFGLVLVGCDDDPTPSGDPSGLTFSDGVPSGDLRVKIFPAATDLTGTLPTTYVALGFTSDAIGNTVTLETESGGTWNESGSYQVALDSDGSTSYKKATVTFTSGSGTVADSAFTTVTP